MASYRLESDLTSDIAKWLQRDGWKVYMEVPIGSGRADLIGERDGTFHLIETKLSMSLTLLEQARDRLYSGGVHFVTVAVPTPAHPRRSSFAATLCREWGVGVIWATPNSVQCRAKPQIQRPRSSIAKSLKPERLFLDDGTAGSNGSYWTPYKDTCIALLVFVKRNPGTTIKDAVAGIKHSYATDASARSTLPKRVMQGAVPGVRLDKSSRPFRLFPA